MTKVKLKNSKNKKSVTEFLNSIKEEEKRKDCKEICKIMKEVTGKKPEMWGSAMVGFDTYDYKYASGREGSYFRLGFSPRKQNLTIYIMPGYQDFSGILKTLGPYKIGKSCLYIKRLEDIHLPTLKKLIKEGYKKMNQIYPKKKED